MNIKLVVLVWFIQSITLWSFGFTSQTNSISIYTTITADGTKLAVLNKANGGLKSLKMADKEGTVAAKLEEVLYEPTGKAERFNVVKQSDGKIGLKVGEEASSIIKFTTKQIDEYVAFATKQDDKLKVMLGEFIEGKPSSYEIRAKNEGYTYFSMENKWDEAKRIVDNGVDETWKDEMWKINKGFIDKQKARGKEFYFSQEPWDFPTKTFRSKEAEYLIDLGAKDFQKINENTWKVVW